MKAKKVKPMAGTILRDSLLVALLLSLVLSFSRSESRESTAFAFQDQTEALPKYDLANAKFYGAASCAGCHTHPTKFATDFVQMNEHDVWHKEDKHALAYDVLKEQRAQNMGRLLGYEPAQADACLNCHAMNFPKHRQGDLFALNNGVSCDGCHGPAQYWFGEHIQQSWRLKSGREKEAWGMIDVRDPLKRTRMCLSCHVGNVQQGKILTHEMYAAGHPPLPSFEIAFFSDSLPRHWRLMRDNPFLNKPSLSNPPDKLKDPAVLRDFIHKRYGFDSAPFEETALTVLGGLGAFRETMIIVAEHAEGRAKLRVPDPTDPKKQLEQAVGWPELAYFDCYACHHDLKSKSWRQQRGYLGIPGRPGMRYWPLALVDLGMQQAERQGRPDANAMDFKRRLEMLIKAYDVQPFGNPSQVATAARDLAHWADAAMSALNNPPNRIDRAAVGKLLVRLGDTSTKQMLDYDSARQVAWAFLVMHREFDPLLWDPKRKDISGCKDPEIAKAIHELDQSLRLKFSPGQVRIEATLSEALTKISNYEPLEVRRKLDSLFQRAKPGLK